MKGKRLYCCEIRTRPWLSQDNCYQLFQLSHLKPVQPSHGTIIVVVLTEFALLNPHIFLSIHLGVTAYSMPILCYCAVPAWAWPNWDFPCLTADTSSNERIPWSQLCKLPCGPKTSGRGGGKEDGHLFMWVMFYGPGLYMAGLLETSILASTVFMAYCA